MVALRHFAGEKHHLGRGYARTRTGAWPGEIPQGVSQPTDVPPGLDAHAIGGGRRAWNKEETVAGAHSAAEVVGGFACIWIYNQLPLLTGSGDSKREEIFYFTDDGILAALRFNDWKVVFLNNEPRAGTYGVIICRAAHAQGVQPA